VGNRAESGGAPTGGGILVSGGSTTLDDSTVSGNVAQDVDGNDSLGGGISIDSGVLSARSVTIARNGANTGGGLYRNPSVNSTVTISHGIVADSSVGSACGGNLAQITADHDIADDSTCGFVGSPREPQLGALANNGGQTDTHALASTSPAINTGSACSAADQRGFARQGACDIGAYEYRAPVLTVVKRVVNDHGGTLGAGDFTVHVRANGADVGGSPKPGSATGTAYTLAPGTYVVGENADKRYAAAIGGSCAANGVVALAEGDVKTCTITNNDKPPVIGKLINARPEGGTVRVKLRGKGKFRRLTEGMQLPNRTIVDTRKGRIGLIAAANKKGGLADADFYDGLFRLTLGKGKRPIVTLTLLEKLSCKGASKAATTAAKKKKKRRLWGDGKGRFRTKGSFSSATVRGTKWLVQDTCTTTLTRVKRGKVAVRDFVKRKTVLVRKNHRYIARAAG
jgi:hypothetical protein